MTKTKISATVVADSKNQFGNRITTMLVTFPRIILAEFNTHRMFSRNTASSRAIPFEKMLKSIEEDPFIPIAWQKDHKGMQGNEYWGKEDWVIDQPNISQINVYNYATGNWLQAKDNAVSLAKQLNSKNITKQLCNRLLEPFMWTTVIVTATEWENFFALRCPRYKVKFLNKEFRSKNDYLLYYTTISNNTEMRYCPDIKDEIGWLKLNKGQAEIHMMALAEAMWDAYNESNPKQLQAGEWHIPFRDDIEYHVGSEGYDLLAKYHLTGNELSVKISTVRCARTSYTVVGEDQKPLSYERMFEIHDNLTTSDPVHASPFEHCALASINPERSRNFTGGWKQYRDLLNL